MVPLLTVPRATPSSVPPAMAATFPDWACLRVRVLDCCRAKIASRYRCERSRRSVRPPQQRGPYCLRHTFATEALAAGISTFELARLMGSSVQMIELTDGHLARDSEGQIHARLDARARQMGDEWASDGQEE